MFLVSAMARRRFREVYDANAASMMARRLSGQALPPVASRNAVAHFTHVMVKMKAEVDTANDGSGMRNGPSRMDLAVQ
jgi:hypothetical protein